MLQYKEIPTLQYMGSKTRIISHICDPIVQNKDISKVIDLFAGTGSIGYALKDYKNVVSNDIEYYSYIINQAILNGCLFSEDEEKVFWSSVHQIYSRIYSKIKSIIESEELYFLPQSNYLAYKSFCDNTPSVFFPSSQDELFFPLEKIVSQVSPGKTPGNDIPCLFLTYYANTYFGVKQCCQIDAIRQSIELISDDRKKNVLLSALMSVMSMTASTTTHFAQYLKVKSMSTLKNLVEKRSYNIIEGMKSRLIEYRNAGLCSNRITNIQLNCYNLDYEVCLDSLVLDDHTLVYADPPYFKEHYSRYYHVLNTLCKYDYPSLALNPQTHELSIGRYRKDRTASDFGKKAKALGAFERLINKCASSNSWLMISYSDNSIVPISALKELAEKQYDVSITKIELNHSKQGRSSTSKVDEYVFLCCPKSKNQNVTFRLNMIKNIKPIVDNPAGFMHNYMARKPYNVISEIINQFCPEGGCVLDPMFGSGTTIIEASKLGRKAIGTDINLLAYKICRVSLTKWDLNRVFESIDNFTRQITNQCNEIYSFYHLNEKRIIERCHFNQVNGQLIPVSYWYKTISNNKLTGRKHTDVTEDFLTTYNQFSGFIPENITDQSLLPNSRIAVGKDDTVFTYFCKRNLVAIDKILKILFSYKNDYAYDILELLVSSAINLIKLSDKKASSQMPYWLPKTNVTSRNACIVIERKAKAFKEGLQYLHDNCQLFYNGTEQGDIILENTPAQDLSRNVIKEKSVDLILTDPPYTDQVPYLEYSQLWYKVMGWTGFDKELLEDELVVSDAIDRSKDVCDFNLTLERIIKHIAPSIKDDGYYIMFYHTFDLKSWSHILSLMQKYNLEYCGQMPSSAPRKSFKTVMSPKATLDGNYIIVFRMNRKNHAPSVFNGTIEAAKEEALSCAMKIILSKKNVTTQDLYDSGMLQDSFEKGYLSLLAEKYKTFVDVISDDCAFSNGIWRAK